MQVSTLSPANYWLNQGTFFHQPAYLASELRLGIWSRRQLVAIQILWLASSCFKGQHGPVTDIM